MTEVTKVQKLLKLDAKTLGKLKEVEQSLASREAKELENAVPDGHPLKAEIEKQKAVVGDLSGLPMGHPLIRALQTAKENYEKQSEGKKDVVQTEQPQDAVQLRKAKRLEEVKLRRERWDNEDQVTDEVNAASKTINGQVDEVLLSVRKTWKILAGYEETLNKTPTGRVKLLRLKRILFATERGLSETRMGKV
jgi:hypothetical protein